MQASRSHRYRATLCLYTSDMLRHHFPPSAIRVHCGGSRSLGASTPEPRHLKARVRAPHLNEPCILTRKGRAGEGMEQGSEGIAPHQHSFQLGTATAVSNRCRYARTRQHTRTHTHARARTHTHTRTHARTHQSCGRLHAAHPLPAIACRQTSESCLLQ